MSMNHSSSMQNGLIDPVTFAFYLLTSKAYHFEYIPRSFPIISLNALGSFLFELCCRQTNRETDTQTNRRSRTSYPHIVARIITELILNTLQLFNTEQPVADPEIVGGGCGRAGVGCGAHRGTPKLFFHFGPETGQFRCIVGAGGGPHGGRGLGRGLCHLPRNFVPFWTSKWPVLVNCGCWWGDASPSIPLGPPL